MRNALGGKVVNGLGWTFGSSVGIRIAQFLAMIALARILSPAHFGVFALANMVVTAITLFRDYGFGAYLPFLKHDVKAHADTTFVMSIVFGLASWLVIYTAAPLAVGVFGSADLIWPLRVMSFSVVMSSFALAPGALLERELEFRKRTVPEIVQGASQAAVSVVLALFGFGVWSLVIGYVLSTALSVIWVWRIAHYRPSFSFTLQRARTILAFGKPLMASSLLLLTFFYVDQAAIGRWLGVAAVGYYNLAFTICHLPATNIAFAFNRVMYPAYSKLNEDAQALRKAYGQTVRSIALISVPVAFWMCFMAHDFVAGFLGDKWLPTVPLMGILAFYGMLRSIVTTTSAMFMAVGEPKWSYRTTCIQVAIALPLVYPVTVRYGAVGTASLFTAAYAIGGAFALYKVAHLLKIPGWNLAEWFRFPLLASIGIASASFGVSRLFAPGLAATAISAACALTLYALAVFKFDRESMSTVRWVMRSLRGKAGSGELEADDATGLRREVGLADQIYRESGM